MRGRDRVRVRVRDFACPTRLSREEQSSPNAPQAPSSWVFSSRRPVCRLRETFGIWLFAVSFLFERECHKTHRFEDLRGPVLAKRLELCSWYVASTEFKINSKRCRVSLGFRVRRVRVRVWVRVRVRDFACDEKRLSEDFRARVIGNSMTKG